MDVSGNLIIRNSYVLTKVYKDGDKCHCINFLTQNRLKEKISLNIGLITISITNMMNVLIILMVISS